MKKELIAVVAVACFFAISAIPAGPEADTLVEALRSRDRDVRLGARHRIARERRTIIKGLIEIADSQDGGADEQAEQRRYLSSKHLATVLLGELRAEEAVPVLWNNLTYAVKVAFGDYGQTVGSRYPAARSLANIGKPASEYVASRLVVTEDPLRQRSAAWILKEVEGEELARHIIEIWLKARRGPGEQANLKAVLKYLDEE